MRPTRNWTTYVPESESALRKKCIELSPSTFPLSSSTSKSVNTTSRCNQNNSNQIKDCNEQPPQLQQQQQQSPLPSPTSLSSQHRNGMKANFSHINSDSANKTTIANHFDDYHNNAIFALSSTPIENQHNDTTNTLKSTGVDKNFENNITVNATDIDVDCDKSSTNLERAPLIQLSPNKSITLVKQNSTSLIFTKKDVNPVVHRKRITLVQSSGTHSNSEITTTTTTATIPTPLSPNSDGVPIIGHIDETISSPKKRHSFHWYSDRNGGISPSDKPKRKQIKSWYTIIGSPSVRELTSFDSDTEVCYLSLCNSLRNTYVHFYKHFYNND